MAPPSLGNELQIGTKLKHARKVRGMNLKQVAEAVACSEGYISKIENNKVSPSLSMLHRIAGTLGINLSYLFDRSNDEEPVVMRADERPVMDLDPARRGMGIRIERVIPYSEQHLLQCNVHIVEPGGTTDGQIEHEGEEVGFVLEGQLELMLDDEHILLNEGDSFCFRSSRPHGYRNRGDKRARILWVNTPPTF